GESAGPASGRRRNTPLRPAARRRPPGASAMRSTAFERGSDASGGKLSLRSVQLSSVAPASVVRPWAGLFLSRPLLTAPVPTQSVLPLEFVGSRASELI